MKTLSLKRKVTKSLLLVPLLVLSLSTGITNAEPISSKDLAEQSVNNYIKAVQEGDISKAANWVIDERFSTAEEQLNQYKEALISNPFSEVNLKSITPNPDDSYTALVELTRKDSGELNTVSYPVIYKDNSWKLVINGQETMSKKVEKLTRHQNSVVISPLAATELGSYSEFLLKVGKSAYSNKFDMTENIVGVTGWQQIAGSVSDTTVRYSIVKKGLFSDDAYGQTFYTGWNYWNGAAFYITITTSSRTYSGVHLKATNEDIGNSIAIRGHIYGN